MCFKPKEDFLSKFLEKHILYPSKLCLRYMPNFHCCPGDANEAQNNGKNTPVKQVGNTQLPIRVCQNIDYQNRQNKLGLEPKLEI